MPKILQYGFVSASLTLAACSGSTAPGDPAAPETVTATNAQTTTAPQGVIPQSQLDAMAKAADVGSVLEQAEQERRKKMEAQGL